MITGDKVADGDIDSTEHESSSQKKPSVWSHLFELARPELARLGIAIVALVASSANNMNAPKVVGKIIDVATRRETGKMQG